MEWKNNAMDFEQLLDAKVKEIEEIISKYLLEEKGYQKTIFQAMNYSILAGGKRIRPVLMLETFRFMQKDKESISLIAPFLAAMEFIHTYSLVHDDLPAMDNDMYRRGKLTTHAAFGHAMGILAGDALLNYAYEIATTVFDVIEEYKEEEQREFYKRASKALQVLTRLSGVYGMVGGQVVDVEQSGKQLDLPMLQFIYELKTSALIKASMLIGGILAGAREEELNYLESIASDIGLAFQIQDDILDITSTQEVLGKPTNSDEKNNKFTFVSMLGMDTGKNEVENLSNRAIQTLHLLKREDVFIEQLIRFLITRKK